MFGKTPVNFKAIGFGLLTDIGGSTVFGFLIGFVGGIYMASQGRPQEELMAAFQGSTFLIVTLVIGFAFTIAGGGVAGWLARDAQVLHGTVVGCVGSLMAIAFWPFNPVWYSVSCLVGALPCAMFGGFLAKLLRKPTAADDDADYTLPELLES